MKKPEPALSFHIILFWCVALPTWIVAYPNYEGVNHVVRYLYVIECTLCLFYKVLQIADPFRASTVLKRNAEFHIFTAKKKTWGATTLDATPFSPCCNHFLAPIRVDGLIQGASPHPSHLSLLLLIADLNKVVMTSQKASSHAIFSSLKTDFLVRVFSAFLHTCFNGEHHNYLVSSQLMKLSHSSPKTLKIVK